ncbi:hypothetical protein K456DRAFT_1172802 [Colletotrichum gloeosporioides 23]|nr:hypothetical protein K456DRAFT_1172802 [Colletotrichum gloeosporioides 23]
MLRLKGASFQTQAMDGSFPMHLAAFNGNLAAMQFIIQHSGTEGVNLPWESKDFEDCLYGLGNINSADKSGLTPLHLAVLYNHHNIIVRLCSSGANKEVEDKYNRTPLMLACQKDRGLAVAMLIVQGAKVDADTLRAPVRCGRTDLLIYLVRCFVKAIKEGRMPREDLLRILDSRDKNGHTPFGLATIYDHMPTFEILYFTQRWANSLDDDGTLERLLGPLSRITLPEDWTGRPEDEEGFPWEESPMPREKNQI